MFRTRTPQHPAGRLPLIGFPYRYRYRPAFSTAHTISARPPRRFTVRVQHRYRKARFPRSPAQNRSVQLSKALVSVRSIERIGVSKHRDLASIVDCEEPARGADSLCVSVNLSLTASRLVIQESSKMHSRCAARRAVRSFSGRCGTGRAEPSCAVCRTWRAGHREPNVGSREQRAECRVQSVESRDPHVGLSSPEFINPDG